MNVHFQQSNRQARIATNLSEDDLALLRFEGTEQVNTLYEFKVEALSTRGDIDFDALIGTHMSAEVDHPDYGVQPFDGVVTQARLIGIGESGYRYDFQLRPWFWLTGKRRNQRIFHEKTVVEILQELFEPYADLGSPAFELRLQHDYPKLEYTVQFSESDLDFACRMMERFGISYYFLHEQQSHTMILTDQPSGFDPVPGVRRPFYTADEHRNIEIEHFWEWQPERNLTTGQMRLTDYNFKKPGAKMEAFTLGDAEYAQGDIESFDWPGRYLDLGRGEETEIGLRMTQERGQDRRHYSAGDCLSLRAGRRVELSGDPVHGASGEVFACLAARHSYVSNQYSTGSKQTEDSGYTGEYVLMPETAPLAPRRKTQLALVHGPQTARVVGEGEIDCDEYGRILVRFHWDLDDAYSMRCRVSQNWAGNGWGGMVIPRIGMEVLVEFLDGDPDKPMVTGCVYNGRNKVPYDLPENKTRSTFKTDTHQGNGFNELRFEDLKDQEEIRMIAQKDLNVLVRNSDAKVVMNDSAEAVMDNKLTEVIGNRIDSTGGSMTIFTGPAGPSALRTQNVGFQSNTLSRIAYSLDRPQLKTNGAPGDFTVVSDGSHDISAKGSGQHHYGRNFDTSVGRNIATRAQGNRSARINGDSSDNVKKNRVDFVGEKYTIVVGQSRIEMSKDGTINISGKDITINGSNSIKLKSARIDLN